VGTIEVRIQSHTIVQRLRCAYVRRRGFVGRYTRSVEWLAVHYSFDNDDLEQARYLIYLAPDDVLVGIFATSIQLPKGCFEAFW
jgi:regulation of enolase protein 1 (concanavalin A-like superfamily)